MNPLNQLAKESGLTREQLAELANMSAKTVLYLTLPSTEIKSITPGLKQLCAVLGVEPVLKFEKKEGDESNG